MLTAPKVIFVGLLIFFLALSVTIDLPRMTPHFFGDGATYFSMAQSLAYDFDLRFTQYDLQRVRKEWTSGPRGVLLKKIGQGDGPENIYYAKPFIYSFFTIPFLVVLGTRGLLIFNSLLFFLVVFLSYLILKRHNSPQLALAFSSIFFLLSPAFVYIFWLTPEIFNMFLITLSLFLWIYHDNVKLERVGNVTISGFGKGKGILPRAWPKVRYLLKYPAKEYLASFLLGLACFSKYPNGIFFLPLVFTNLCQRRVKTAIIATFIFTLTLLSLFGAEYLFTGDYDPYSGNRIGFLEHFPFEDGNSVFPTVASNVSKNSIFAINFKAKVFFYSLFYYFVGRYTGLVPYFFAALVSLYFWLSRKKEIKDTVLLSSILLSILAYIVLTPNNYSGGAGAVGNRYFLNIYPAFIFLVGTIKNRRIVFLTGIIGLLLISPIVVSPLRSSIHPQDHGYRTPFKFLPVELSLLDFLPTYVDPLNIMNCKADSFPYYLYFMDDNTYKEESGLAGFWVKGKSTAELVLRAQKKEGCMLTSLYSVVKDPIRIEGSGYSEQFTLFPEERKEVLLRLRNPFPWFDEESLYKFKFSSKLGFIPKLVNNDPDTRFLGCFVKISVDPLLIGCSAFDNKYYDLAIRSFKEAIAIEKNNVYAHYFLAMVYEEKDILDRATVEFAEVEKLLSRGLGAHVYEAEKLPSATGEKICDEEASKDYAVYFYAERDGPGYLVHGPTKRFPRGEYKVSFKMKAGEREDLAIARIDVYGSGAGEIVSKVIKGTDFESANVYQDFQLTFYNHVSLDELEFRVKTMGKVPVCVDKISLSPTYIRLAEVRSRIADLLREINPEARIED